jgi:hypothetical protein
MMIRRSGVLAALLAVLFAAGCAGTSADDPAVSAPTTPSAQPSTQPPSAEPGSTTLTGTIAAGVEGNCFLLKDDSGSHLLVFKDPALRAQARPGMKVTVVGTPQPGMVTTCQQGVPFVVSTLTR